MIDCTNVNIKLTEQVVTAQKAAKKSDKLIEDLQGQVKSLTSQLAEQTSKLGALQGEFNSKAQENEQL